MSLLDPAAALAAGITVVTPNNRLARTLIARHDAAQLRAGRRTWTAARALPWSAWIATLWRDAREAGIERANARLLADFEVAYLWRQIVAGDPAMPASLVDVRGSADLAAQAWQLVHGWGAGGQSWRAWRDTALASPGSDVDAFILWAERYQRDLAQRVAIDIALAADALASLAAQMPNWRGERVLLAGFLEISPQQQRLLASVRSAGMSLDVADEPARRAKVERIVAQTARDEVVLALQWARERAQQSSSARIGIAIEDLSARRDEVRALAEDVLCPALQLPGHAGTARPYDLSLGLPLAEDPVVAAALSWLALAHGGLDRARAAALFRSPYGPGRWTARAGCELGWIEESRAQVSWADAVAAMHGVAPAIAATMREALRAVSLGRTQSPREWVAQWRTFLDRCGWPGEAVLAGAQYEAREAFARSLEDFARLGHLEPRLAPAAALGALRDLAQERLFQPQAAPAPIAIMGLLEAASVSFDALWIAGLSGHRWPPAPQPNPLLPLGWQREHSVPRSSAARELAFAVRMTDRLARCAQDVVMSAPAAIADYTSRPSPLAGDAWPAVTESKRQDTATLVASVKAVESLRDDRAPVLPVGGAPGGTGAIAAQSDCPFMAMAKYRLCAQPWPTASEGLNPMERGQLVHAMMAAFWQTTKSHAALVALDSAALGERIADAAAAARALIPTSRWQVLPGVIAAAEAERLPEIAVTWIEAYERPRPGFTVDRTEAKGTVEMGGLTFRLKLDRVDALPGGGVAIIDYKTGLVDSAKTWFTPRPRSPQLGVYYLALVGESPAVDVKAVAYGRLKAGEVEVVGFAAEAQQWPALTDAQKQRDPPGWQGIGTFWRTRLPALAAEIREGVATVTPRGPKNSPCRVCARQSLCRVQAAGPTAFQSDGVDDDR